MEKAASASSSSKPLQVVDASVVVIVVVVLGGGGGSGRGDGGGAAAAPGSALVAAVAPCRFLFGSSPKSCFVSLFSFSAGRTEPPTEERLLPPPHLRLARVRVLYQMVGRRLPPAVRHVAAAVHLTALDGRENCLADLERLAPPPPLAKAVARRVVVPGTAVGTGTGSVQVHPDGVRERMCAPAVRKFEAIQ